MVPSSVVATLLAAGPLVGCSSHVPYRGIVPKDNAKHTMAAANSTIQVTTAGVTPQLPDTSISCLNVSVSCTSAMPILGTGSSGTASTFLTAKYSILVAHTESSASALDLPTAGWEGGNTILSASIPAEARPTTKTGITGDSGASAFTSSAKLDDPHTTSPLSSNRMQQITIRTSQTTRTAQAMALVSAQSSLLSSTNAEATRQSQAVVLTSGRQTDLSGHSDVDGWTTVAEGSRGTTYATTCATSPDRFSAILETGTAVAVPNKASSPFLVEQPPTTSRGKAVTTGSSNSGYIIPSGSELRIGDTIVTLDGTAYALQTDNAGQTMLVGGAAGASPSTTIELIRSTANPTLALTSTEAASAGSTAKLNGASDGAAPSGEGAMAETQLTGDTSTLPRRFWHSIMAAATMCLLLVT